MSDDVWQRDEIESPCIKLCVVHPATRLCTGCFRSIDEISAWSQMTAQERRMVLEESPSRAAPPPIRRGGRAARLKRQQD